MALPPAKLPFAAAATAVAEPAAQRLSLVARHAIRPKNIKWKKIFKPSAEKYRSYPKRVPYRPVAPITPMFGRFALQALEDAWVSSKQIENTRRALVTAMGRRGRVFIRIFPHQAINQRVAESRMGASKGFYEYWVAAVKPNFILFEVEGVSEDEAYQAFRQAAYKLPCKVKFMKKEEHPTVFELPSDDEEAEFEEVDYEEVNGEPNFVEG